MKTRRYKRNYRWLFVPFVCITLAIIGITVLCTHLFENNIQRERIPHPLTTQVSVTSLKNIDTCTWDESLMLINKTHPLDKEYPPSVSAYKETDIYMSSSLSTPYFTLSQAVEEACNDVLYISSAYRTHEEQEALYEEDPTIAAKPYASEHESGLALDVYVSGHAGKEFINSDAGVFINNRCHEYGFIIRYPKEKAHITGFLYEPWHLRYVGVAHSSRIKQYNLTLEEYIESLEIGAFYRHNKYILSRQKIRNDTLLLPTECDTFQISPDNTGCYIITGTCKEDKN